MTSGDLASETPESTENSYLSTLNEAQAQAVRATDGPVLVLAGAGTGKTRVLTTRIAHILLEKRAFPGQILAVTFTNKAAREMKERVAGLIGGETPADDPASTMGLWLGTFHSIAARILRRHAEVLGFTSTFTILDVDDQIRLIKQLLAERDIDDKKHPAKVFSAIIQSFKDKGLTPERAPDMPGSDYAGGQIIPLYHAYQQRLKTLNAVDFGDLLLHNLTLFTEHHDILQEYTRRFRYILVDEYQDTNVAQYLWLRLLAQEHRNICCVGDDDQSIYGWRGAEVGNILKFEQDFPGAEVIRLECNYRSTPHILAAASGLIAHNKGRLGKTLWTDVKEGEKIRVKAVWDDQEEARAIGDEIESMQRNDTSLNDMAILVRAGFQTRAFEERFMTLGLPYRVVGGLRFYERQEIRDAIAYIRVLIQPNDDLAFERIINTPKRGIGKATMEQLHRTAREHNVPLTLACRLLLEAGAFKPKMQSAISKLLNQFERWRELLDPFNSLSPPVSADAGGERAGVRGDENTGLSEPPQKELLRKYARNMRHDATDAENKLWYYLRNRQLEQFKFRRQHPIDSYIVDFVCPEKKLIIELDGSQHMEQQADYDTKRTEYLESQGYRVLRFWNNEMLENPEGVLEAICNALQISSPHPGPLPMEPDDSTGRGRFAMSHTEVVDLMLEESGYREMWQQDKSPEAPGRLENLRELLRALEEFEDLTHFLEHVGLVSDTEADANATGEMVNIMTLHAAKGLEFNTVFLPGWEEGLFPSQRSVDESGKKGLEEERRLAYVGITRARRRAIITHAANRRIYGQWQSGIPSRFIEEIPAENLETIDEHGIAGGRARMPAWNNDMDSLLKERLGRSPAMQEHQGQQHFSSSPKPRKQKTSSHPDNPYKVGSRVTHEKFGTGKVVGINGDRLDIVFEKGGLKKVLSRFVTAA